PKGSGRGTWQQSFRCSLSATSGRFATLHQFPANFWHDADMSRGIRNVVALAFDGVAPFELGVVCEAWGIDRSEMGLPVFDFAVCAPPSSVRTHAGLDAHTPHSLDRVAEAALVGP